MSEIDLEKLDLAYRRYQNSGDIVPINAAFTIAEAYPRLAARIRELEAAARWIPVTEQLPKDTEQVLFYCADCEEQFTGEFYDPDIGWFEGDSFHNGVTHWKRLGAPPEKQP